MTKVVSLIILISALISPVASPHNVDFKREQLSQKGQVAYDMLSSTCVFRVGAVGYGAITPPEEFALYDLLEEAHAVEALKSLVAEASYEGGLYGLLGLSLRNNTEFNRAVDVYKARQQRPERAKKNSLECGIDIDNDEQIVTQSGCLFMLDTRAGLVLKLQSGWYDRHLLPKYRPRSVAAGSANPTR